MGANVRLRTMTDYMRQDANMQVRCSCGNMGVLDTRKVARWFKCHRWNEALEVAGGHLRCRVCRGRPASILPTTAPPDRPLWMALEHDWVRLVKRLRD